MTHIQIIIEQRTCENKTNVSSACGDPVGHMSNTGVIIPSLQKNQGTVVYFKTFQPKTSCSCSGLAMGFVQKTKIQKHLLFFRLKLCLLKLLKYKKENHQIIKSGCN